MSLGRQLKALWVHPCRLSGSCLKAWPILGAFCLAQTKHFACVITHLRWIEEEKPLNRCYLCARDELKIDFVSYITAQLRNYFGWGTKKHRLGLASSEGPMKLKIRSLILASLAPASQSWISLISHRDHVFGIDM